MLSQLHSSVGVFYFMSSLVTDAVLRRWHITLAGNLLEIRRPSRSEVVCPFSCSRRLFS